MTSEHRISLDETRHVARLSKLDYSEAELKELNLEMSRILDTVSKLDNVPVEGLEAPFGIAEVAVEDHLWNAVEIGILIGKQRNGSRNKQ